MSFERCNFNNRLKGQHNNNIIYGNNSSNEKFNGKSEHKAIYPVYLIEKILNMFTFDNDIILDPFMGSGTTAVACQNLNRRFIGFELEQRYVDIANQRLKDNKIAYGNTKQLTL
jgi:DNA modification methylase